MSLPTTIFDRLKRFFREQLGIPSASLTEKSKLGTKPLGFEDEFIDSDLRHRINEWFDDIVKPFPPGQWDSKSTLGGIVKDIVDETDIGGLDEYRAHAISASTAAFDREIGNEGTRVPVADRPTVRDHLNDRLVRLLIRDVALSDLSGERADIIEAIVERMVS